MERIIRTRRSSIKHCIQESNSEHVLGNPGGWAWFSQPIFGSLCPRLPVCSSDQGALADHLQIIGLGWVTPSIIIGYRTEQSIPDGCPGQRSLIIRSYDVFAKLPVSPVTRWEQFSEEAVMCFLFKLDSRHDGTFALTVECSIMTPVGLIY